MLSLIYTFFISLYFGLLRMAAFFHSRARLWVEERKNNPRVFPAKNASITRYWVHCASLGEFDQARPVLQLLEKQDKTEIFVSFFSPSGYRQVAKRFKQYHCFYLPPDLPWTMNKLFRELQPDLLLFVKYELWYNCLLTAAKKNVPAYLFSAYFHEGQRYFKWPVRFFYKRVFRLFEKIFVLDNESQNLLKTMAFHTQVVPAGDTRIAQCLQQAKEVFKHGLVDQFCKNSKVIICGSTWPIDEQLLASYGREENGLKLIVAPHDLSEKHLLKLEKIFADCNFSFSSGRKSTAFPMDSDTKILIWDQMGTLKYLYRYAAITYIGGGFTGKLHNILEAAVYFKPIIIGPKNKRFPEAEILRSMGLLRMIDYDKQAFANAIEAFLTDQHFKNAQENVKNYFFSRRNAAKVILNGIKE